MGVKEWGATNGRCTWNHGLRAPRNLCNKEYWRKNNSLSLEKTDSSVAKGTSNH